jgi:hypothetical protein
MLGSGASPIIRYASHKIFGKLFVCLLKTLRESIYSFLVGREEGFQRLHVLRPLLRIIVENTQTIPEITTIGMR